MRRLLFGMAIALLGSDALAAALPDFSGRWVFDPSLSQNVGMMAQAKLSSVVAQTATQLVVDDHSEFRGKSIDDHTTYDLGGAPVTNISKMSGKGTTTSKWDGANLVTTWNGAGNVPGQSLTRVETRFLSADRKTMFLVWTEDGGQSIVIAFDRAR